MKISSYFIALSAICLLCVSSAFASPKSTLDGKEYVGTIKSGTDKPDPDSLIFKEGKFTSTACEKYGFGSADYTTSTEKGAVHFKAETKNDQGNKIAWTGTVKNGRATAKGLWSDSNGKTDTFNFDGKQKK